MSVEQGEVSNIAGTGFRLCELPPERGTGGNGRAKAGESDLEIPRSDEGESNRERWISRCGQTKGTGVLISSGEGGRALLLGIGVEAKSSKDDTVDGRVDSPDDRPLISAIERDEARCRLRSAAGRRLCSFDASVSEGLSRASTSRFERILVPAPDVEVWEQAEARRKLAI